MEQAQARRLEAEEAHSPAPAFDFAPRQRHAPPARRSSRPRIDSHPVRPAAERRTVEIAGRTTSPPSPRRSRRRPGGANPDRLALWAVVLCLFMALVAAATARGDEPDRQGDPVPAAGVSR